MIKKHFQKSYILINSKTIVIAREVMRRLLRMGGLTSSRDCEYCFALREVSRIVEVSEIERHNKKSHCLNILDIGACGSVLPLQFARIGHHVVVVDCNKYTMHAKGLRVLQGDFLEIPLPSNYFDCVIMISTIEHLGIGAYGDPIVEDADARAITRIHQLLRANGHLIVTFPYSDVHQLVTGFERWYDNEDVRRLFGSWDTVVSEFYLPRLKILGRWLGWRKCSSAAVRDVKMRYGCPAVGCFVFKKREA